MGSLSLHMFDVRLDRSERKKWIHQFEDAVSIVFFVDLNQYDDVLLEESSQNRLMETLVLFDSVVNSYWFRRTSIVLLFCNAGRFKEKLRSKPLGDYFSDYSGGNDINRAARYLFWRFSLVNRRCLNLYPHLCEPSDDSNMRLVKSAVKETIVEHNLKLIVKSRSAIKRITGDISTK